MQFDITIAVVLTRAPLALEDVGGSNPIGLDGEGRSASSVSIDCQSGSEEFSKWTRSRAGGYLNA